MTIEQGHDPPALSGGDRRRRAGGAALACAPALGADAPIRQGYQTNMWGMPTYYLLRSGAAGEARHQVRGIRRAVRQPHHAADGGAPGRPGHLCRALASSSATTKAAWSRIAMIEYVGKTARVMARKDLGLTKVEQLKGLKVANQTGSSTGNIFVDQIATKRRPEERRLPGSPHGRERHGRRHGRQDRGRHGQCRALQRDRRSRRPRQHAHGLLRRSTRCRCSWRRRRISSTRTRTPSSPISRPGSTSRDDFKEQPEQGRRRDLRVLHLEGLHDVAGHLPQGAGARRGEPGFPADLEPYMQQQAEILLKEKKIKAIPDWNKALAPGLPEEGAWRERKRHGEPGPAPSRRPYRQDASQEIRNARAENPLTQDRRARHLEFQAARAARARRLRRHGRGHVDADRQGRPAHHLAGARERAEEFHRRRRLRSAQAEGGGADRSAAEPTCARTRWRSPATSWRSPTRRRRPGRSRPGFELFDISVPEKPRRSRSSTARGRHSRGVHQLWFCDGEYVHMASGAPDFKPTHIRSTTSSTAASTCAIRRSRRRSGAGGCRARARATMSRRRRATALDMGYPRAQHQRLSAAAGPLYLGYIDGGMFVMDIADKANPKLISRWDNSPPYHRLHAHGAAAVRARPALVTDESTEDDAGRTGRS